MRQFFTINEPLEKENNKEWGCEAISKYWVASYWRIRCKSSFGGNKTKNQNYLKYIDIGYCTRYGGTNDQTWQRNLSSLFFSSTSASSKPGIRRSLGWDTGLNSSGKSFISDSKLQEVGEAQYTSSVMCEKFTQRFYLTDFPAARDMTSTTKPATPEQGTGVSFTRDSQKAIISAT